MKYIFVLVLCVINEHEFRDSGRINPTFFFIGQI